MDYSAKEGSHNPVHAPVVFSIRFSVLERNAKKKYRKQVQSESLEKYRNELFSEERLNRRLHSLVNVTLSSLAGQSDNKDVHALVYTSKGLPEKHFDALCGAVHSFPFAKIISVGEDDRLEFDTNLSEILVSSSASLYAHVRIDDDDAISRDFVNRLREYIIEEHVGYAVSFGRGVAGVFDQESCRFTDFFDFYRSKISVGFALIGCFDPDAQSFLRKPSNAYALGSHSKADRRAPVILDSRDISFIYAIHPDQDSSENSDGRRSDFGERIDIDEIKRIFALGNV